VCLESLYLLPNFSLTFIERKLRRATRTFLFEFQKQVKAFFLLAMTSFVSWVMAKSIQNSSKLGARVNE